MTKCNICDKEYSEEMESLRVYVGDVVKSESETHRNGNRTTIRTTTTYKNVFAKDLKVCQRCQTIRRWFSPGFVIGTLFFVMTLLFAGYMIVNMGTSDFLLQILVWGQFPFMVGLFWWAAFKRKRNLEIWAVAQMNSKNTGKAYLTQEQYSRLQ